MVAVTGMKDNADPCATTRPANLRRRLLAWYDRERRTLAWRAERGARPDPYAVWISEIMLQQTTVTTAGPYYRRFLARWPTVDDLAAADLDDVLQVWQGLGYYARARNLHACARHVVAHHGGRFPDSEVALRSLPGVGEYTAAAIAAIAFDRPATPVDGNVARVMARLHAIESPLPAGRPLAAGHARVLSPPTRPGDFAQALMDLGALVCTPRRPRCDVCPWLDACAARRLGTPERFPIRLPKAEKPVRRGVVFWLRRPDGTVLLRRRPPRGLLGGLMEFPTSDWRAEPWTEESALSVAPATAAWIRLAMPIRHVFSHFRLELTVFVATTTADNSYLIGGAGDDVFWWPADRLAEKALPTVMTKVAAAALAATDRQRY
jgi:A/G-specific adenine glycosylase